MMREAILCTLCQLPTYHPLEDDEGGLFCCVACQEVSVLLKEEPLTEGRVASESEEATAVLQLGNMWCPSCAWLIQERLQRTPGVATAETNFVRREARVNFDPAQTSGPKLVRRVRRVGYRAWLEGDTPYDEEEAHWLRLLVGGLLAMKVMVISFIIYFRHWLGLASPETAWLEHLFGIMMIPLTLGVVLVLGWPIARAGLAAVWQGRPNTHSLVALGALAAFGLSIRNVIVGGAVYFDTTAVLLFLLAIGRWLEMRAQKESHQVVEKLWQRIPPEATWLTSTGEQRIAADKVPPGGRVRVRPGERVPVDGLVAVGRGDVDESWLTGEPEPVLRQSGDAVLAGSINLDGSLEVVTTAVGAQTMVGQVGRLLHEATWQRAPVERLADRIAAWMMPIAVLLALGAFAFWSSWRDFESGLIVALSVLLIACPCALGIATPLTLWLGLGRAAEAGIILRRTGVLEQLAQVRQAFFDKTGTLTERPLQVKKITAVANEDYFRAVVAAVEQHSEHPLGQAIANCQLSMVNGQLGSVEAFRVLPGQGVTAQVGGKSVWIGSRALMAEADLTLANDLAGQVADWQEAGLRVVYAGWDGMVQGLIGLGERWREETAATLGQLAAQRIEVTVLTGDEIANAARWQQELGIAVHAGLRPEEKLARLQTADNDTLMVGDGINDGPALVAATVGLALRQGTDIACAAADAVLLHDDLRTIPWLVALAQRTITIVRQNLAWSFAYNIGGLLLALSGLLQPSIAALLMVMSNLVVTSNALRLRRWSLPTFRPVTDILEIDPILSAEYQDISLNPANPYHLAP